MTGPRESWRLFFPLAAALAALGLAAWGAQLAGLPLGLRPADHGAFLLWGALGAGVQGFLYTAYAKQNEAPLPGPVHLRLAALLHVFGAGALLITAPSLRGPAALGAALPWLLLLGWTLPIAARSLRQKVDPTTAAVPLCLLFAALGAAQHVAGLPGPRGLDLGTHLFLLPLALSILDRVLPFFAGKADPAYTGRRRPLFIPLLLLLSAPKALGLGRPVVDGALLLLLLRQWWGWAPWPALRRPMIGVLHLGPAWIALGFLLGLSGAPPAAALHALLVGGLGSLLLALSMRVARGHGGLPLVLGRAGFAIVLLGQLAALGRVGVALLPAASPLLVPSAALLLGAFGLWLLRFGPVSWRA